MATISNSFPHLEAWDGAPFQVFDGQGAYDPVATQAALDAYVADHPAPPPADPPAPPAPTEFFLSKVLWQRRLTDAEFAALDAIRITVLNRPADWATSSAAPWPTLRGFVRPVLDYDAAGEINLLDPAFAATLGAIAATTTAFGSTPEDQAARIAVLLSTGA